MIKTIISFVNFLLNRRDRMRDERRAFDLRIEKLMTTLKSFLKKLHSVEKDTRFQPENIDSETVKRIAIIKKRDAATGQSFSKRLCTLRDIHPSKALNRSLRITLKAHKALVRQIHGPPQKLAPAAKAAYEAYKKLYRALFREQKFVDPRREFPDDSFFKSILDVGLWAKIKDFFIRAYTPIHWFFKKMESADAHDQDKADNQNS